MKRDRDTHDASTENDHVRAHQMHPCRRSADLKVLAHVLHRSRADRGTTSRPDLVGGQSSTDDPRRFAYDRTPLANSPDWLKSAPMQENLLASWRQSGQKQDHCPSLLNHNAKYKRLLPPYCDFANGVRSAARNQC